MAGRWSELLGELLDEIETYLVLYGDKVRIRAVCNSWNSNSHLEKLPDHTAIQLPLLLQPLDENNKAADVSHGLFHLSEKKFYYVDLPAVARGKLFIGFSHGWLSTIQYLDPNPDNYAIDMHLVNPFTNAVIPLPPRIKFPDVVEYRADRVDNEYCVLYENFYNGTVDDRSHLQNQFFLIYTMGKVIVSSPPTHDDCVVVAIYGMRRKLAYCRPNDEIWTPIQAKFTAPSAGGLLDILFYQGKLYGLNMVSGLVYFDDISSPNAKMTEVIVEGPRANIPAYLVESSDGGLFMVTRDVDVIDKQNPMSSVTTLRFCVYTLDDSSSNPSWIKVEDVGDDILFVGYNSSVSRRSRDFPGYKGNCIYFTDSNFSWQLEEFKQENSDIGVFDMKDGSVERFSGFECNPRFIWPLPIWVTPSPTL